MSTTPTQNTHQSTGAEETLPPMLSGPMATSVSDSTTANKQRENSAPAQPFSLPPANTLLFGNPAPSSGPKHAQHQQQQQQIYNQPSAQCRMMPHSMGQSYAQQQTAQMPPMNSHIYGTGRPPQHASASSNMYHMPHGAQMAQPPQQQPTVVHDPNYRPLNVKDALSYLDQVKIQFHDRPDVYNKFLDIMKEFKSQSIDTPGVIERVSSLFKGHTMLIVGFNTFLPPGYRIEINQDQASFTITVPDAPSMSQAYGHAGSSNYYVQAPNPNGQPHQFQQQSAYCPPPVSTSAAIIAQGSNQAAADVNGTKKPVEFNHAINYVNKIKNRFVQEPDVYKNFLEILRTYQNESRPIGEVYAAVQELFQGSTDLLEEFKQFLPDTSAQPPTAGVLQPKETSKRSLSSIKASGGGKNNRTEMESISQATAGPIKRGRFEASKKGFVSQYGATEEFEFFEKVKKVLGNKTTYSEFLKVLNLFNQDIIDPKVLVVKVSPFLAKTPELLDWFKSYVKFDDADEILDITPSAAPPRNLDNAKRSGASYRLLPKDYIQPSSNGRDSFCYEILNDYWVCHPTWASEDGGFVAHKKNLFEDALFCCEEERYEFDLNIDANKSVIQRLEPIAKRIAEMSLEEQRALKLPDGLGDGFSKTIYKRVIRKIYDKDRGLEIIDSLHEYPAVTVPIVLKRLKQKDEEWRRNQREWNKVWREIDGKNFYRSLDHQGINFKVVDKKAITSKSLIAELETLYREHNRGKSDEMSADYQLEYQFPDLFTVQDVKELAVNYIVRASGYTSTEQERIIKVMERLLEHFCIPSRPKPSQEDDDEEMMQVEGVSSGKTFSDFNTMFCNNTFYLFFRMFQLAYTRLRTMREASANISANPVGYNRVKDQNNSIATNLDLIRRNTMPVEVIDGDVYKAMLVLIRKLFEGDLDPSVFEEQSRFWFGTSAYIIYTIDKVIHNMCKQVVHIATDPRSMKLLNLFVREHTAAPLRSNESQYRQKADELIEEGENLIRLDYVHATESLRIQLLGQDQKYISSAVGGLAEAKWSEYIDNYVKINLVNEEFAPRVPVFMNRALKQSNLKSDQVVAKNELKCKICINTYKMFFVEDSEDSFIRINRTRASDVGVQSRDRQIAFHAWWDSHSKLSEDDKSACETWFAGQSDDSKYTSDASKTERSGCVCRCFKTLFTDAVDDVPQ